MSVHKKKIDKKQNLLKSLDKVAMHFSEVSDYSNELKKYTKADIESKTVKVDEINKILACIHKEEKKIFQEFLELKICAGIYLTCEKTKMITMFKPYQIISEFLKNEKTGKQSEKNKMYTIVFKENSTENIHAYLSSITYNDRSYLSVNLILDILQIWKLFLQHSIYIDIDRFNKQINTIMSKHSIYNAYVPEKFCKLITKTINPIKTTSSFKEEEKKTVRRNVIDRLKNIEFRYNEIEDTRSDLLKFKMYDLDIKSNNYKRCETLTKRYLTQEKDLLSELVHLHDNIRKYLYVYNLNKDELNVIENFIPFKIASNYVNCNKHGIRGKKCTSLLEYTAHCFNRKGKTPSPDDQIVGLISFINGYNGELIQSDELIKCLIPIWEIFIRNHTNFSADVFKLIRNNDSLRNRVYSMSMPEVMITDAKKSLNDRKNLDIIS